MKTHNKRLIFIIILLSVCTLDFVTFYFSKFKALEINPIIMIGAPAMILIILKFGANAVISWKIIKPYKTWGLQFFYVLMGFYLILGQGLVAYINISTSQTMQTRVDEDITAEEIELGRELTVIEEDAVTQDVIENSIMPEAEAFQQYQQIAISIILYPLISALIGFKIWQHLRLD